MSFINSRHRCPAVGASSGIGARTLLAASLLIVFALSLVLRTALADEFLPVREAFRYSTALKDGRLSVRYEIAPGYYLYQKRLGFETSTPGVKLGAPQLPTGEDHEDEYFGKQVIYRGRVDIPMAVTFEGSPREFDLELKLQGCADAGLCYPPTKWTTRVPIPKAATASAVASRSGGFDLRSLLGSQGSDEQPRFLQADQAFALAATEDDHGRIALEWQIADGYYLYRDRITVKSRAAGAELGRVELPEGETHHDEYFGEQVVYRGDVAVDVPVARADGKRELPIEVTYQGCADEGLCYPPIRKELTIALAPIPTAAAADTFEYASSSNGAAPVRSEQDTLADRIRNGGLLGTLAIFFGAGLLLAFTPCMLPMVPILSGIIVGAGRGTPVSRTRAFSLSLAYVLGMAFTYTIAGALFAAAGQQAQAFFQKPWMVATFAAIFVMLALGMFGVFTLQMPAGLQARFAALSNRQSQGTLLGTGVMGALSSLIVTACVAPPLVAALAVIGQTGDVVRGGAALFAMSLGMGAPLLLLGASAGHLLPKAGAWMDSVKAIFGVLLLGVAVWMLSRILPGPLTLALWAALAFVTGYCLMTLGGREIRNGGDAVRRGAGALATVYGILMLIGSLAGRSDPLQPLAGLTSPAGADGGEQEAAHVFTRIKTVDDLERAVAQASVDGRPVMLDFYADWCVSCKEMERYTFSDAAVRAELSRAVLLQADVTANDDHDQALLEHFGILGPPTIVFFDGAGREMPAYRVVGYKAAQEFREHLIRAFGVET